jgi:hypothetical protein
MRSQRHPIAAATPAGFAIQAGVLAAAAGVAWAMGGDQPARNEALAFTVAACLAGLVGGWAASQWRGGTPAARVSATLGVVGMRLFPALAALGWLQTPAGSRLREAGAGEMLLGCYLAVLAADVILNIMGSGGGGSAAGPTAAN